MTLQGKAATGVAGLDDITSGGFARGRLFLLEGCPGTGKTSIATQFMLEGAARGERGLYVTLSETEEELRASAASHGWNLDAFAIHELLPPESLLDADMQQSLLYSSDIELGETTKSLLQAFDAIKPDRVVIDSLSEIRLLAQSALRYRRQILALKHYLSRAGATVLMLDDTTAEGDDKTMYSIAHGVIHLEELAPDYGAERRRLKVLKYRGQRYRGGFHDFIIETGGVKVFPRLVSAEHHHKISREQLATTSPELNALLGGGIERGSSTLILGPTGAGKSLLALSFVVTAIARGEKAALFIFDEEIGLLLDRALQLGIDLKAMRDAGDLLIDPIDAAELSPGEFSERVRSRVEKDGARTIVIDSLNGFRAAMPGEHSLTLHMHELLQFLSRQGASTLLTVAQQGLVGDMKTPVEITYLADTVILLRYFEALGQVRRAISVVKKRTGAHENTIREYLIDGRGITVGQPLTQFQGVLRGVPEIVGMGPEIMQTEAQ